MKRKIHLAITVILFCLWMPCLRAQVLPQDSLALVAFYNSTGGPNWTNHRGWLTGPVNTWYGVTVEENRVLELKFYSDNNLNGTIPKEIGGLYELKTLVIGNNLNLTGVIPEAIFNIDSLVWFGIGNCSITGTIPNTIGNCSLLKELDLSENSLTGSIPPEIGNLDSLLFLDLHGNQLTGSIPEGLGNCTKLWELLLFNNQLSGNIPSTLVNCNQLSVLNLSDNRLTGSLPENFSSFFLNYENPISLNVSHNELGDSIPESWGGLYFSIDALDISYNHFFYLPVNCSWLITFFSIDGNKLTFDYLEPHYHAYQVGLYYFFDFSPQDEIGEKIDTALVKGSNYYIYSGTGGEYCNYKWYKNGELILESPEADTLHLNNITDADTGIYNCVVENTLVPMLLYRRSVHISITTVGMEELSGQNVTVYPNPCRDMLAIETSLPVNSGTVTLTDLQGRLLMQQPWPQNATKAMFNLKQYAPGVYLMRLIADKKQVAETKLVVAK